jgi:HAMP domain-containing protein
MKWNSISTKVLATMGVCLVSGLIGTLTLLNYSFVKNSQAIAEESVVSAQRLFGILEARDTSKMIAVSETLEMIPEVRDAFAARDRSRLLDLTAPLYVKLKAEGITNWMFHTPEPAMSVFLRLHNPAKFGDQLNRFIDGEVVRTHAIVAGNELARAGFATRIIRPFYDSHGQLTGYVEFGEEIGRFIHEMKSQTGDDYGLLLNKKYVDRQFWADTNASMKHRDKWSDHASFVVADNTSSSDNLIQFQGDLASVGSKDAAGQVLERYKDGDSIFVRGIFPIFDATHNTVGAMFVVRNISAVYISMRNTQRLLVTMSVIGLTFAALLMIALLNRLIFRRLQHIIRVATRVVGGDFETEIVVDSDDEIGQFEQLFEQFRCVFVDLMASVSQHQENEHQKQ